MATEASKAKKAARMKAWREANKDDIRAYQKQWREANKDFINLYQRQYQSEYRSRDGVKHEMWVRAIRDNYRMTPVEFNALWLSTEGKCSICACDMAPKGKAKNSVCIDHNHANGEVRGLLCRQCNQGLGHFNDSPTALKNALRYLLEKGHYSSEKANVGEENVQ